MELACSRGSNAMMPVILLLGDEGEGLDQFQV